MWLTTLYVFYTLFIFLFHISPSSSQPWVIPQQINTPTARYYHKMMEYQGAIYSFGGTGPNTPNREVRRYHLKNSTWDTLPDLSIPMFAFSAIKTDDDVAIFFGGSNGTRNNMLHTYDLKTNTFNGNVPVVGDPPAARSLHTAVFYDKKMIVYGGGTGLNNRVFNDTWSFDAVTFTWTELTPLGDAPTERSGHTAVVTSDGIMVVYGGFNAFYQGINEFYNDVAYYDIKNNTWLTVDVTGTPPIASYDITSVLTSKNIMIIFGGVCANGATCYDDNIAMFNVNTSSWIPQITYTGPSGRSGLASALLNDMYLIIFGGTRSNIRRDDLAYYELDYVPPTADTISTLETISTSEAISTSSTIQSSLTEAISATEETTEETTEDVTQPSDGIINPPEKSPNDSNSKKTTIAAVLGSIACIVVIVIALVLFFVIRKKRERSSGNNHDNLGTSLEEILNDGNTNYAKIDIGLQGSQGSIAPTSKNEVTSWEVDFSEVEVDRELGRGAYGVVFKGKWRMQDVAVKKLLGSFNGSQMEEFIEEAKLMSKLRPHANVIQFLGLSQTPLAILTSYCDGGSFLSFLKTRKALTENEVVVILLGVVAGMEHLHIEKIIHRDLAARNILIGQNAKGWQAVVSDFGFARAVPESEGLTQSVVGPVRWMAPESIQHRQYSTKTDVWSFGVLVWETVTKGGLPWGQYDEVRTILAISNGEKMSIPPNCPKALSDIMQSCWESDPDDRPTFQQLYSSLMTYGESLKK